MKKAYQIFIPLAFLMFSYGCNYLDEKPYDWAQPSDIFSMEANYEKPINQAYSYITGGFNRISGSFLDAATDDGISTINGSAIHRLARGYVNSNSPVEESWSNCYLGIGQALFVQKSLNEIKLVLNNKTEAQVIEIKNTYSGEMYALRALFEFRLLQHYAGFPIVDKYLTLDDPELKTITRSSFADCVEHIVNLCDSATKYLNPTPVGAAGGYGRMTRGAALAIKAKTLVYAASPLFNQAANTNPLTGYANPSAGVQARWERAAEACAAVINLRNESGALAYSLYNNYEKLFITNPNSEYIVMATAPKSNSLENRQYPPSLSNSAGGGTVPTQEFVDAFTKNDGADYARTADPSSQYRNRDPRFNVVVGYNGSSYGARGTILTKVGDGATIDGLNVVEDMSTNTGYYLRKFLDVNVNFKVASPATTFHVFPIIRLADILLLYAEAMNEAYGFNQDPKGFGLTAAGAVQRVRTRAGFAGTDKFLIGISSVERMREKIKQERRIELSFEEQRYFDLRRWLEGDKLNQPVGGIRIDQKGAVLDYDYFTVDDLRKFEQRMYLHPIPLNETLISPQIQQNPGW